MPFDHILPKKKDVSRAKNIKKNKHALEKRMLLDAASVFAAVEAISDPVFHLDAQDIDGDNDTSAGDQPTDGSDVNAITDGESTLGGSNNASLSENAAAYDDDAFGTGKGGLLFDGTDEYRISNQNEINNAGAPWSEKSFAVTFRTGLDTSGFQVIYEQGGGVRGFHVAIDDGNIYASAYNNTGTEWGADRFKIMNLGAVAADTTYNVIMVFDSNAGSAGIVKSNLNGGDFLQLESVGAQTGHPGRIGIGGIDQETVRPTTLAFPVDGGNFKGHIGEIWAWNHALTDQEISDVETYQTLKWTNRVSLEHNTGATVLEGAAVTISNTELSALDDDTANAALTYQVVTQTNGSVQLSGVDVGVGGTFTQADIDAGNVTFLHDDSETSSASFDFKLTDGGWLVEDTFTLDVTPVDDPGNDSPIISTNEGGFVQAGGTTAITAALLETTDADHTAAQLTYTVTSTKDGSVFNTSLGTVVTTFTQADIDAGFIEFQHDGTVSIPANFGFDVSDGSIVVSDVFVLGVDLINTAADDPPVVSNNTGGTIASGSSVQVFTANLQTIDPDNSIDQLTYTITSLVDGNVTRAGVSLSVGQTFTQADVDFGIIAFLHDGGTAPVASFGFDVSDGNTTVADVYNLSLIGNTAPVINPLGPLSINEFAANGTSLGTVSSFDADGDGLTYSIESGNVGSVFQINPLNGEISIADNSTLNFEMLSSYSLVIRVTDDGAGNLFDETTVVINVTDQNDAPVLTASGPFNIGEFAGNTDAVGTVTATDEDVPADTITYSITGGTGAALFNIDNAGNITVNGNGNFDFESGTTSYTIDVFANDGAVNSNTETITINITDVDDAPTLDVNTGTTVAEGSTHTVLTSELSGSDSDSAATDLVYTVTSALANGQLELAAAPGVAIASFTQDDLDNGRVVYVHDSSETLSDSFDFTLGDATTTLASDTFSITVTPVNDAPTLTVTDPVVNILEGGTQLIDAAILAGSDSDDAATDITYTASNLVNGQLEFVAAPGVAITSFTQDDIDNNLVQFVHDSSDTLVGGFDVSLADGGEDGAVAATGTVTIGITPVDDAPTLDVNTGTTVAEGSTHTVLTSELSGSDSDSAATDLVYTVTSALANGQLELAAAPGVAIASFTQDDLDNGRVVYVHDSSETLSDSFDFTLGDATTTLASDTFSITVTPVNDAPTLTVTDPVVNILEGGTQLIDAAILAGSDSDDAATDITYTASNLVNGQLEFVAAPGVAITSFTQDDIDNNLVQFVHDSSDTLVGGFDVSLADGGEDGAVAATGTVTIGITPVDDAPTLDVNTGTTVAEGSTHTVLTSELSGSDSDSAATDLVYTVTSALANGQLELAAAPGVAIASFTQDDLDNGRVVYVHDSSETLSDSFDFTLGDATTTLASDTFSITVTPVNDAPTLTVTDPVVNILEGGTQLIDAAILAGSDSDDAATDITYTASNLVNGQLEFVAAPGVAITSFTQDDIDNNLVQFVHDSSNTLTASFDVSLADGGEDGAVAATGTVTINITDVDDAPTLDVNTGTTVAEGSTHTVLTSELSGSDSDSAATDLVYTVTSALANGQLELAAAPGVAIASFTQDDLDNGRVVYVHDSSETLSDSFDFTLGDATTTLASDTFSITVTPVNDAPTLTVTDPVVNILEGGTQLIDAAILAGSDSDDAATDITYTASNLVNGQLEFVAAPGVAITSFTQDDIDNNLVQFVHDSSNTLTASFDVSLADGGEDGAVAATGTVTIGITPVDDAPTLDVNTGTTVAEGSTHTVLTSELSGSDSDSAATDLVYTVTSALANGQLELAAAPGVAIASFTQDDLDNGRVVYVHDSSETLSDSFDFTLGDATTTLASDTFSITVTPVNDAPTLTVTDPVVNILEGGTQLIDAAILAGSDSDDAATDITYTASNLVNGQLEFVAAPGVAITSFTQDDIDNNLVQFVHDSSDTLVGGFDVSLADGGEDGAVAATGTVTIGITPVDDAPTLDVNTGTTVAEGSTHTVLTSELSGSDSDSAATDLVYTVTSALANGQLELAAAPGVAIASFTQDDLDNGRVVYVHDSSETLSDSFDFTLGDATTTLASDTFSITVTPVNDAPTLTVTDPVVNILEGGTQLIDAAILAGSDSDDAATDITYTASNLVNGQLEFVAAPGVAITSFTQDDIDNNLVQFVHDSSNTLTASFDVSLADGGEDGAVAATGTVTIGITPVDDAPTLDVNTGTTVAEGSTHTVLTSELSGSDSDSAATDLVYTVTSALANGQLELAAAPGVAIASFTQDDLDNGRVVYVHDSSETLSDSFDFTLGDATTTLASDTFSITVTPVNDAPTLTVTDPVVNILEGGTQLIDAAILAGSDSDDAATDITYTASNLVNGQLEFVAAPGVAITSFTQDDIDNNLVQFVHDSSNTLTASFDVSLADGGEDGAVAATGTVTINITDVDDAPTLDVNTGTTVAEGSTHTVLTSELSGSDSDSAATDLVYTVTSALANGQLELAAAPGVAIASFTQDDLDNGRVVYVHDSSETLSDSFDFTLGDATTTLASDTFSITVTPVNDAPTLTVTDPVVNILEGGTQLIDAAILAGSDSDDAATDITYTASNLVNGQLEFVAAPGVAITSFTQDDIDNNLVQFVHDSSDTLVGGFDVSLADGGEDGAVAATGTVTINITDVDDAPTLDVNTGTTVAEGSTHTVLTSELSGSDSDSAATDLVYTVTSALANGQLELAAAPGVAIASFTQDDLDNGRVVYVHDSSETLSDSFDFTLGDATTTLASDTFSITVTPVNDAPTLTVTDPVVNILEGGTQLIDAAILAGSDSDDAATDITYTASNLVNGQLEFVAAPGVAITSFTQDDIDNNLVQFVHDSSDTLVGGFDVSLADGGEDGAVAATGTVTIGITPVDDAPTLDVNTGTTVAEGSTHTVLTSELSGSDSDSAATDLVYTVTSALANGQLELAAAPGVAIASFTQDDLDNGRVVYVHDSSETLSDSFDFTLGDATTTLASDTFSITVTPVNDAPTLTVTDPVVNILEGGTQLIDAAILAGSDSDDAATDITYTASNLVNGQLEFVAAPGVAITSFTQDDIDNNLVQFVHDSSNTLTASFDVSLADGGEDGAVAATGTVTINITDVDDAPTLDVNTGTTVAEGSTHTVLTSELSGSDSDSAATDLVYTVTSALANGQLELAAAPGVAIASFTQDDLDNGRVVYVHDSSETLSDSFDFTLGDATTTLASDTFSITVTPVNDAPTLTVTDPVVNILEGGTQLIDAAILAGSDSDDAATDITYTASNLVNGQLEFVAAPGVAITSFTQDDIDNNLVQFVHDSSDTLVGGFDVSLADGGEDGAVAATGTVTIGITPVDDAPTLDVNTGTTVAEGSTHTVLTSELSGSDSDSAATDLVYTVTSALANGQLELAAAPGVAIASFTQDDLDNGRVVYVHDSSETLSDSFDFTLGDATTTLASDTFSITVTPVNDAPTLTVTDPVVNILEGGTQLIDAAILAGSDSDDAATDITYTASNLVNGQLEFVAAPGVAITSFTQDDIDNNLVQFVHDSSNTLTASFDVSLADGGEDGAVAATGTVTINITDVDDAPTLDVNTGTTVAEGSTHTVLTSELSGSDSDSAATDLVYTVTSALANGQLELAAAPGVAIASFTQDDLDNGRVVYVHDSSETLSDSFDFTLGDATTTLASDTFSITVTPVNDAPTLTVTDPVVNILEGGTQLIDAAILAGSDSDDAATDITYTASNLVNGQLEFVAAPGVAITSFTQDDIDNNLVQFVHDSSNTLTASFDVSLADGVKMVRWRRRAR